MRLYSAPNAIFPDDVAQHGVVLAVSGGSDSVALMRLACETLPRESIIIAHFNHVMRGKESDADARFVDKLAMSLGVKCVVERFAGNTISRDDSGSIESTLRAARYDFLLKTAESFGFRYVATGHTRDDQVETVLHRILRGTGLAGLAAIPQCRVLSDAVTLVRPLLHLTRETLLAYLAELKQPFCNDESNSDAAFTRNRIRHTLLPLLRRENPDVDAALVRLSEHAAAQQEFINDLARDLCDRATITISPSKVVLKTEMLRTASPFLVGEAFRQIWRRQLWRLRAMGQPQWQRLVALIATGGKCVFPDGVSVCVDNATVTVSRKE